MMSETTKKDNGSREEPQKSSIDVDHSGLFMEAQGDQDIMDEFLSQALADG